MKTDKPKKRLLKVIIIFILFFILSISIWTYYSLGIFSNLLKYPSIIFPEKQYLILLQNNYELRPTGGFISAYAKIKFWFGIPTQIKFGDSYEIDHTDPEVMSGGEIIKAPQKIEELLNHPTFKGWTFRDSNFDPDFKMSSQKAIEFYNIIYPNEHIDGVISINISFFEDMLDITGPIHIGKYTIDKNNFFQIIQFESKNIDLHNVEALRNRKDFIKDFYTNGLKQISFNLLKWKPLFTFLQEQFDKKNIQVYMEDKDLSEFFRKNNWDGNIELNQNNNVSDNFLYINGANYGGRKSDRYIAREVSRHILHTFSGSTIHNKIEFTLNHNGDKSYFSNTYIGYYRFFIPKNAYNITTSSIVDVDNYGNKLKYVEWTFTLDPQETTNIVIEYDIPIATSENNVIYKKQSGIINESYNLYVHAPLEIGITSNDMYTAENTATYKDIVHKDTINRYKLQINKTPLMVIYQDFNKNTKRIEIRYDRVADKIQATDINNYIITDKNINHPNINDNKLKITKTEYHEDFIYLWCKDAITQEEEHYNIQIKNQKDRIGNNTLPEIRDITVIMR